MSYNTRLVKYHTLVTWKTSLVFQQPGKQAIGCAAH